MAFAEQLRDLRTDYLSGKPVKHLQSDFLATCTWSQQAELIRSTCHAPPVRRHGDLSRSYRHSFLRHLVRQLEAAKQEVHDDLYTELAATLVEEQPASEYAWKHFELWRAADQIQSPVSAAADCCVSIRQRLQIISDGTTGLHTWQAAGALAEWAIANREELRGRRVLELGSGTGLTGLVVAKVCEPQRLILSDGNQQVVELLQSNVRANGVQEVVEVRQLSWTRLAEEGGIAEDVPDVILAADVVYDRELFGPLCEALVALFEQSRRRSGSGSGDGKGRPECRAFVAATERNADTLREFREQLDALGFQQVELDVPEPRVLYWDQSTPIKILRITRQQAGQNKNAGSPPPALPFSSDREQPTSELSK